MSCDCCPLALVRFRAARASSSMECLWRLAHDTEIVVDSIVLLYLNTAPLLPALLALVSFAGGSLLCRCVGVVLLAAVTTALVRLSTVF